MKFTLATLLTATTLLATSHAYVVELYSNDDCTGTSTSWNVWDNSCAYTTGFQSLKLTTNGGDLQQLIAYSPQACAGTQIFSGCAAGVDSLALNECHQTTNGDGGSNALSSYSSGGDCPN